MRTEKEVKARIEERRAYLIDCSPKPLVEVRVKGQIEALKWVLEKAGTVK